MPYSHTPAVLARVRAAFETALEQSAPPYELGQLGLFADETEAFIRKEVERKLYEPKLPCAGDRERKWIARLELLAADREWTHCGKAFYAAQQLKLLLPREPWHPGRYYTREKVTIRTNKKLFEDMTFVRQVAEDNKAWDKKWFAEFLLDGMPEAVSDFRIECLYLLRMPDGKIERRVRLVNILGEASGEVNLDSKAFASPEKFRDYCLGMGNFSWSGNQTELQMLHEDINREAAWKMIHSVVTMGWTPLGIAKTKKLKAEKLKSEKDTEEDFSPELRYEEFDGVWFMGDSAYRDGKLLEMQNGCYWIARRDEAGNELPAEGYQVADEGRENPFFHKKPKLCPAVRAADLFSHDAVKSKLKFRPVPVFGKELDFTIEALPKKPTDGEVTARFFREFFCRLKLVCGESAQLCIGGMLAFAAGPEIFHHYSLFPGIWLHGSQNSGKSTILEWLMEIWGFQLHNGIILRGNNSTAVGLQQAADQYSHLPVWLDEFRAAEVDEAKMAVVHNAYNRGGQAKFNLTKIQRTIRTTFCISGESTTGDSALRGRYPHVQVAKSMRQGWSEKESPKPNEQQKNFEWFVAHRGYFYLFGRFLLENRREFVRHMMKHLDLWQQEDIDPRLKIVHGVSYAAFMGMVTLLQEHAPVMDARELSGFKAFMLDHAKAAAVDVKSGMNTKEVWEDLIAAVLAGEIPDECFLLEESPLDCAPDAPNQTKSMTHTLDLIGGWQHCELYIEPNGTLKHLQAWLSKQRSGVTLKRNDLRDQLSKEAGWIECSTRRFRFTRDGAGGIPGWGFNCDEHELGYQPVDDEAFKFYCENPKDGDPRMGPLFEIVQYLRRRKNANKEEER